MVITLQQALPHLRQIAETSPTNAIDAALKYQLWTPGTSWHHEEVLCYVAQLAAELGEYRLAGLAAYQAQWLHKQATGQTEAWGLPILPGLEIAGHQFNITRYIPLRSQNLMFRSPDEGDRNFLLDLFSDAQFRRQYSRPAQEAVAWRVFHILDNHNPFPKWSTEWNWIVCDKRGEPIGLMELNALNFYQGSADLALGFRHSRFGTLGAEAYLMAAFIAFHHLDLQRLTTHVYTDNEHSNHLVARVKMEREYSIEKLVQDRETGEWVGLTTYSMLRDEFRQWPLMQRVAQRLDFSTVPDLLRGRIHAIANEIITRGPAWRVFPPEPLRYTEEPPTQPKKSAPLPQALPAVLADRFVRLRRPDERDSTLILDWLQQAAFMKLLPENRIMDNPAALMADTHLGDPTLQLWLVEPTRIGTPQGLIGIELVNRVPVLFLLAGFTPAIRTRDAIRALKLLRHTVQRHYPDASCYGKLSGLDDWLAVLNEHPDFSFQGTQRHYRHVAGNERGKLSVFTWFDNHHPMPQHRQTPKRC
ncbi:MAG: GNAT family protein [Pseudomonadota bacterium]